MRPTRAPGLIGLCAPKLEVTVAEATLTEPRRKPRGTYAKTEKKRAAILNAAMDVFSTGGYRAGSLRDIAERVGMSEPGIFHYFSSKSALLTSVLELRDELAFEISPLDVSDPVEAARGLVRLVKHNASIPGVVALHCTISAEAIAPEHPAHEFFVRRYDFAVERFTAILDACAKIGALRAGVEPRHAARVIISVMDGLQVQWLLDRDNVDMPAEFEKHLRSIVDLDMPSLH